MKANPGVSAEVRILHESIGEQATQPVMTGGPN